MIVFLPTNFAFDRSFLCDQIDDLLARVERSGVAGQNLLILLFGKLHLLKIAQEVAQHLVV